MEYKVCHVEIAVTDKKKTQKFYNDVFKLSISFESLKKYGMVNSSDVTIGFHIKDKILPNESSIYIYVEDIPKQLQVGENTPGKN